MKIKFAMFREAVMFNGKQEKSFNAIVGDNKDSVAEVANGFLVLTNPKAVSAKEVYVPLSNVAYLHPVEETKTKKNDKNVKD